MFQKLGVKNSQILIIVAGIIGAFLISFVGIKIYQGLKNNTEKEDIKQEEVKIENSAFSNMDTTTTSTTTKKSSTTPTFKINETNPEETANKTEEEVEDEDEDKTPEDNDSPDIDLSVGDVKDKTLSKDDPVYLIAEVTDDVGGVDYVEFYINDDKKATIEPRGMNTKSASGWSDDTADDAFDKAVEYIKDKYSDSDLSYAYRKYNKFNTDSDECSDVEEGYIFIILGKKYLYDVRVSEDLDDLEVCYKGKSLNYYDTYVYLFTDGADDYEFYVKAYDTYKEESKSEKIEFELE